MPTHEIADKTWGSWRDQRGWTVLHMLVEHVNRRNCDPDWLSTMDVDEFLELAKARGADVNAFVTTPVGRDPKAPGCTPLLMLCHRFHAPNATHEEDIANLAKSFLEAGADPCLCSRSSGRSPLSQAMVYGRLEVARHLVEAGAHPRDLDEHGHTVHQVANRNRQGLAWLDDFVKRRERAFSAHRSERGRGRGRGRGRSESPEPFIPDCDL